MGALGALWAWPTSFSIPEKVSVGVESSDSSTPQSAEVFCRAVDCRPHPVFQGISRGLWGEHIDALVLM